MGRTPRLESIRRITSVTVSRWRAGSISRGGGGGSLGHLRLDLRFDRLLQCGASFIGRGQLAVLCKLGHSPQRPGNGAHVTDALEGTRLGRVLEAVIERAQRAEHDAPASFEA